MKNKEIKYHYFFDLNEILIDRYPAKISKEILKLHHDSKFVFIYSENYNNGSPKKIPHDSVSVFMPQITSKKIYKLFELYPPKTVTTIAQRIPDLLIILLSNRMNIPTSTVQHGIWSNRIKRISIFSAIMIKFSKFKFYLINSYNLSKALNLNYVSFLYDCYNFFYRDLKKISEIRSLNNRQLRANLVFAFDNSWNNYYTKKFKYKISQLKYIGNPDLLLLNNKNINKVEDSVCYICQSLVEDGRYLQSDLNIFLKMLKNKLTGFKKLYVKLHPRTKMENYKIFQESDKIVFTNDFPLCSHYVGHYSSLLLVARKVTSNVLIWKLKNHYTPENFFKYASIVTNSEEKLMSFINSKHVDNKEINIYKPKNPYKLIAEKLVRL